MAYESNFDLFQLFITKNIRVWNTTSPQEFFIVKAPAVKDFYTNEDLNLVINLLNCNTEDFKEFNPFLKSDDITFLQMIESIFFDLGIYKQYWDFTKSLEKGLKDIIPTIVVDKMKKKIFVKDAIELTDDICIFLQKLIKLICGDNKEDFKPSTKEAKKFYAAQKEQDKRIAALRAKYGNSKNKDGLLKIFLFIEYAFPTYSHEYLLNQTMAQIQWLHEYAAGAVSYKVNSQVFAAGNMKKGSKLDFFIK